LPVFVSSVFKTFVPFFFGDFAQGLLQLSGYFEQLLISGQGELGVKKN